jgi:S-adenosylmethionine-diacylglycerol 3-amino-3-carboxypropyl transferase
VELVGAAVHRNRLLSKAGLSERTFTFAFSSLVYPQIWEDPVVDLEALALAPGHQVIAIASGGCNLLSYLTAAPVDITAVDLNTAHVALNRLKIAAARYLPGYEEFHRFFGNASSRRNITAFDRFISPHLDLETLTYWNGRDLCGRRRIERFARGFYRFGLLGRFIAAGHLLARLYGRNPRAMLAATSREDQRRIYERELKPLFDKPLVRRILDQRSALFGLGIPPAQYKALSGGRRMHEVIEERLERLACDFDLRDNYFAWQAFNRGYADGGRGPLPPYLEEKFFQQMRENAVNLTVRNVSFTDHLASRPDLSADRYVLLDAQDWMTETDLTALWSEITRTARPGARVIFRTAGTETILPGRVPDAILRQWDYEKEQSAVLTRHDRSAIYGGFHLYVKAA